MASFFVRTANGELYSIDDMHGNSGTRADLAKLGALYSPISESYSNPNVCQITNSDTTTFNCYKVPSTHTIKNYYKFPATATAPITNLSDPSYLQNQGYDYYGYSVRYSGTTTPRNTNTSTVPDQGTQDPQGSVIVPEWCNSVLIYSVGGGGGGGGKGGNTGNGNSGNGADGANGSVAVARLTVTPGTNIVVYVGNGGQSGAGTANSPGDARPGAPSYVRYPSAGSSPRTAEAFGGAGANAGNAPPGILGQSGNSGTLQPVSTPTSYNPGGFTLVSSNAAYEPPNPTPTAIGVNFNFPPTAQVARGGADLAGAIGRFGSGSGTTSTAGTSGTPGMVAIFFKSDSNTTPW